MTNIEIKSLDDIIFSDRNQAYGAYQLRKDHNKNSLVAMVILYGILLGAFGFHFAFSLLLGTEDQVIALPPICKFPNERLVDAYLPPPNADAGSKQKENQPKKSSKNYTIVQNAKNVLPILDSTEHINDPTTNEKTSEVGIPNTTGNSTVNNTSVPGNEEKISLPIPTDEAATFLGGEQMLRKYITNSFEFPEEAISAGLSGILVVYFEIDEKGKIKNVKITKSFPGAENFEKEAIEVIKNMPDWTPRKINGKAVKTKRMIPINCKL